MDSSKIGKWVIPFNKFSRLRVNEEAEVVPAKVKFYFPIHVGRNKPRLTITITKDLCEVN